MSGARVGYSFEGFEGEIEKILLFGEDSKWSSYAELLEYLDDRTRDIDDIEDVLNDALNSERYSFSDITWRIGKRFNITGRTPVEQAAARQWIQYRITRLGFMYLSEMDKRHLEDILQVLQCCLHTRGHHHNNPTIDLKSCSLLMPEMDDYLKERTYFAGTQFSIADLVMYSCTALHEHLYLEVSTQRIPYKHCNLVRWFDQVQHHYQSHTRLNHYSIVTVIRNSAIAGTQ
ncbi:eukaryotic translation elongation factor 1 epsilon-1-like isoform X1 [Dysidea avara]|uniref:eukaryotic translation elongation factor 1 epsilon-1-like isoform X1 n=1 Tax=Dysidea avara TaxID=196820 RepID=UPI00332E8AD4